MMHRRSMLFVDGENLTIRSQNFIRSNYPEYTLDAGPSYEPDVFIWLTRHRATDVFEAMADIGIFELVSQVQSERAYYYTSCFGDDGKLADVKERLWSRGFHPEVFKKRKDKKAKAVDICLAKDFLSHAFLNNYDTAILVAGDRDYLPLIEETKRLGKRVVLWFFSNDGLSNELRLALDNFIPMERVIENYINDHSKHGKKVIS